MLRTVETSPHIRFYTNIITRTDTYQKNVYLFLFTIQAMGYFGANSNLSSLKF
jgi:hypothetical protein